MIGKNEDSRLEHREKLFYCVQHGLEEVRRLLNDYHHPLIFMPPGKNEIGGSFLYTRGDFKVHDYSLKEENVYQEHLNAMRARGEADKILWLNGNVIFDCFDKPLFRNEITGTTLTKDEVVRRLSSVLYEMEATYPRGEYWFAEPRDAGGIYLWSVI
ncbi:MAG: hypothetical protein A3G33_04235 [Omnitrophica bacterium RIFCSPLOWO2_12_FULL_44_17]|uniref:Uncharacterized protein n=1 Tax=Candidatus Danuiimicrobium aquiferis TaxID=1801832 RepID=A0A1G1KQG8_9BACT|nr:MAG: hypothetical protein A3B72_10445 [Omnitrophica bacterium RIFCSPHIGHO2_02_FULL_45_28]OGW89540.1 MAG: hypothetical protein A3E74_07955 [Omnitrophica bacterium RIFCSPHIGHO2_12_FULL_44_12]OGW95146.1 MAG: hypothetical protein A3G33_04235 [Omnitrophica bacterium RIFCSPLOWO2_12_FULL_44_17]OGX01709.1 MAG: hypothetical protein A3J12_04200 [Omnitrophica bacterium RIFCSPLOWO2_02_FULL_44_11]